jgi:hypothetical protein
MNRITNLVFNEIGRGRVGGRNLTSYNTNASSLTQFVANVLGEPITAATNPAHYMRGDFFRCLHILEALFEALQVIGLEDNLSGTIQATLNKSEIDLGVDWQPPIFVRTGARLLDERLVDDSLHWLREQRYTTILDPFEKGLSHYLESINRPERLADVVTDMYEATEALARLVTGKDHDLSRNRELFIKSIQASNYYKQLLKNYIEYGSEFRHAVRIGRPRPPLSEAEVEAFIYLTGLFIRLAIRTT